MSKIWCMPITDCYKTIKNNLSKDGTKVGKKNLWDINWKNAVRYENIHII